MTQVWLRDPWPPHRPLAALDVQEARWEWILSQAGAATLICEAHPALPGAVVSIHEPGWPVWAGWVTSYVERAGDGAARIQARDPVGSLLPLAVAPDDERPVTAEASQLIASAIAEASARGAPPIPVQVVASGGARLTYERRGEPLDQLLRTLATLGGLDWRCDALEQGGGLRLELVIGTDLGGPAALSLPASSLLAAEYAVEPSLRRLRTLVVAGEGTWRSRPRAEALGSPGQSPLEQGTEVIVDRQLASPSARLQPRPNVAAERWTLLLDATRLPQALRPGDRILLSSLPGAQDPVEAMVRGLSMDLSGSLTIVCERRST